MNESRLINAVGFIGDDLISEAAEYRPAAKKPVGIRIAGITTAGCAAAAAIIAVFAVGSMNNVKSDNRPVVSGELSNSASIGTNDLPSESGNSARTLADWLNDPAVVWSEDPLKGGFDSDGFGESVPLGTTMISEKWLSELSESPDGTVYAVTVDFMSCIDEAEMESWELDGDTIGALKAEQSGYFFDTGETMPVSYIKDGEWYTEYQPVYSSKPEDADRIAELEQRIEAMITAYYGMKIESFRDSFSANGLGVFDQPIDDGISDNRRFYTFATREQLENFKCKENEAFYFMPAFRLK